MCHSIHRTACKCCRASMKQSCAPQCGHNLCSMRRCAAFTAGTLNAENRCSASCWQQTSQRCTACKDMSCSRVVVTKQVATADVTWLLRSCQCCSVQCTATPQHSPHCVFCPVHYVRYAFSAAAWNLDILSCSNGQNGIARHNLPYNDNKSLQQQPFAG